MPRSTTVTTDTDDSALAAEARRLDARASRYAARRVLWDESSLERVQTCGREASGSTVGIRVTNVAGQRRGGFAGVKTCGSVWACPCCSEKIGAARQADLEEGIRRWQAEGHGVELLTLTMRHDQGDGLAALWDALGDSFSRTIGSGAGAAWTGQQGKPRNFRGGAKYADPDAPFMGQYSRWSAGDAVRYGLRGYVRLVEVKVGANGWHPHVHALLFTDAERLTPRDRFELRSRIVERWTRRLGHHGFTVVDSVGVDLRHVSDAAEVAHYLAKNIYRLGPGGAAYEVTGSATKTESKGGRTPFDLLRDVVDLGDADALDLWHEWEQVSRGRRQLTWSHGLRDLLGLDVERTDEEIAEDDSLDGETVVVVSAWAYRVLIAPRAEQLLAAVEISDRALKRLLDSWGVDHAPPPQAQYKPWQGNPWPASV